MLASGCIILTGLTQRTSLLQILGWPVGVSNSSLWTDSKQSSVILGLSSPVHSKSRIARVAIFCLGIDMAGILIGSSVSCPSWTLHVVWIKLISCLTRFAPKQLFESERVRKLNVLAWSARYRIIINMTNSTLQKIKLHPITAQPFLNIKVIVAFCGNCLSSQTVDALWKGGGDLPNWIALTQWYIGTNLSHNIFQDSSTLKVLQGITEYFTKYHYYINVLILTGIYFGLD